MNQQAIALSLISGLRLTPGPALSEEHAGPQESVHLQDYILTNHFTHPFLLSWDLACSSSRRVL